MNTSYARADTQFVDYSLDRFSTFSILVKTQHKYPKMLNHYTQIVNHLNHLPLLFKLVRTLVNLERLSTSAFKAINSFLAAKLDVQMPVAWSNSFLVA